MESVIAAVPGRLETQKHRRVLHLFAWASQMQQTVTKEKTLTEAS